MPVPAFPIAPVVETERLILRPHRPADHEAYARLWADPVTVRFIGGRPFSRSESWGRILRQIGHWRVQGFGFWALEEKASGALVGEAGFHDLRRDVVPAFDGVPEAGWALAPGFHGRGLAREAVEAIHSWGDRHLGTERCVCIIEPENHASLRIARAIGYADPVETTHAGTPILLLTRPVPR
ncbi:GNAT family N-acetyltransferase [Aquibium microcysteis]|uniref:GNAT family N-acetyltransferase n=1 Tax=Aquibium microcysteis TaxID=675281 RepID=UPI00165D2EB0|nr:GNAT family N-acetyltransferase [Aquibium microcysteis]